MSWDGKWPKDLVEYDRLERAAVERYRPIVAKLPPWEVGALITVTGDRLADIKARVDRQLAPPVRIGR